MNFDNQIALVAGGASGMGKACVSVFTTTRNEGSCLG